MRDGHKVVCRRHRNGSLRLCLFIYLGFYVAFNTVQVISRRVVGRAEETIEFARVVYCKLPTNGKQLPAFPLKAVMGIEPPTSEVGGESVTTLPPWPPLRLCVYQSVY